MKMMISCRSGGIDKSRRGSTGRDICYERISQEVRTLVACV